MRTRKFKCICLCQIWIIIIILAQPFPTLSVLLVLGRVHTCSGSRSGPVPLVRVAFTPATIDQTRSGCGPVTRSHLFRNATGTRTVKVHPPAHQVFRSDIKVIIDGDGLVLMDRYVLPSYYNSPSLCPSVCPSFCPQIIIRNSISKKNVRTIRLKLDHYVDPKPAMCSIL